MKNLIITSLVILFVLAFTFTPSTFATLCFEQIVYVDGDDEMLTLCEQDDLWKEIDSIWKYLETNVGISGSSSYSDSSVPAWLQETTSSNSNNDAVSTDLQQLTLQNQQLNSKIIDLDVKITQLEKTVEALSTNSQSQQTEKKSDCWFFC